MAFVRNQWYAAIWSSNLGDEPVGLRILDQPIVLFRTSDGDVVALDDLCPHRFAPLHLGKTVEGGRIRCGYHGLEFDRAGLCVHNPHTSGRIPPAAKVRSYSAVERHGMVWIWPGDRDADLDLLPDLSVLDGDGPKPGSSRFYVQTEARFSLVMKANYVLIVENLLDLSHACVLHDSLLGNIEMADAQIGVSDMEGGFIVRRLASDAPLPKLFALLSGLERGDTWTDARLIGSSCLLIDIGATRSNRGREGGTGLVGVNLLTPIDEETTLYHVGSALFDPIERSVEEREAVARQIAEVAGFAFSQQDKIVLEAQQSALSDKALDTSRPAMFDIDIGSTRYARHIKLLLESDAAAPAEVEACQA